MTRGAPDVSALRPEGKFGARSALHTQGGIAAELARLAPAWFARLVWRC
jgi:hypothetical protein